MGIAVMFMLLATLTPFLFIHMKKRILAVLQTVFLVGMWLYFLGVMSHTAPAVFSLTWSMFYLSLIIAEVAWVMFIIHMAKQPATFKKNYQ